MEKEKVPDELKSVMEEMSNHWKEDRKKRETENDKFKKVKEIQDALYKSQLNLTGHACPRCGYCPHCGRGGWLVYPVYPTPWNPNYPGPGPVWSGDNPLTTVTGGSNLG
jgi:hypothetical protein